MTQLSVRSGRELTKFYDLSVKNRRIFSEVQGSSTVVLSRAGSSFGSLAVLEALIIYASSINLQLLIFFYLIFTLLLSPSSLSVCFSDFKLFAISSEKHYK